MLRGSAALLLVNTLLESHTALARLLKGPSAYILHDTVACRNDSAIQESTRAVAIYAELQQLTTELKRTHHLEWTGNVGSARSQIHAYHHLVKQLARQRRAAGQQHTTLCETGFNAGHSALLFLLSDPSVRYFGWDLADPLDRVKSGSRKVWASGHAASLLQRRFPGRINVTFGDSHRDIVPFFEAHAGVQCDIISVDGDHSYTGVQIDLSQLEPHLADGGLIFADDCNPNLGKGRRSAAAMFEAYAAYVTERNASLKALLRMESCSGVKDTAGFCIAAKGGVPKTLKLRVAKLLRRFGAAPGLA